MSQGRPPCGTRNGCMRHRRHGEQPCAPCLAAARVYQRSWSHATGRSKPRTRHHGTKAAYDYHRKLGEVACEPCRAANRQEQAEQRRQRVGKGVPRQDMHGKASTYTNWMCRCRPCVLAHSADLRARRLRRMAEGPAR